MELVVHFVKVLYNSYIRSKLEYCSSVWYPSTQQSINKIERVQKRFVKFLCYRSNVPYHNHNYKDLCNLFRLAPLQRRREVADHLLFYKFLHNRVQASDLLSNLCLNAPVRRTRHTNVFATTIT